MSNNVKGVLLGLTIEELIGVTSKLGMPTYVGKQIAEWLYKKHVVNFEAMSNLSKATRETLRQNFVIGCLSPVKSQKSVDGTIKYLYPTQKGDFVETVYIPNDKHATLCVSSQVGCKMGCIFCMTGRQGYVASLIAADILNQIYSLPERDTLTNIVFMGQGEPFDNLDAVLKVIKILTAPWGYGWSPKRITVSSVGLRKGLTRFINECECHLAISLHHPIAEERAKFMPAERAFGIYDIVKNLEQYDIFRKCKQSNSSKNISHQRRLSFEYIVFDGVNDSIYHANALIKLVHNLDCRINLIRFHDIPNTPFHGISEDKMLIFRNYLTKHGLFATVRASRGQDIFAACGLLTTAQKEEEIQRKKISE